MNDIFKMAIRNLWRYKRRTLLTSALICLGVVAVLVLMSVSGSFKKMMIGQITDSMLGQIQIHARGYLSSIESLPLDRNMRPKQAAAVVEVLENLPEVEAWSERIRLGAMFSNFTETTNIRLSGVDPEQELATVPMLTGRIIKGKSEGLLKLGEIVIPEIIAKGARRAPGGREE